jgi:hypothetical protein
MTSVQDEIKKIKQRNKRVENDKAWETSKTRKIIISVATYFIISLFLLVSNVDKPFVNALIPTTAFILSTVTLPFFKKLWLKHIYKG